MTTVHNYPEARKILRIRTKQFWDLPRELRDMIYSYTLVEPILHYRRHKAGCPFRDLIRGCEKPIFEHARGEAVMTRVRPVYQISCAGDCEGDEDCEWCGTRPKACQQLCRGRPGLAMLRTCWMIYEEASPIFWDQMFCFTDSTQLIWAFGRKSEKALSKVCRISLLEERSWGPKWYEKQRLACALLPRMTNLVELELDPWKILRGDNGIAYLQPLMHLRQLRVVSLHEVLVGVKRFGQDFGDLWVRVAKDLIVKGCWEPETHISAEPNHGCFICWSENPARADWNSLWRTTSTLFSQPDTVRAVHKRLGEDFNRRRIPAYTGQDPQPVDLETANEHGLEVGLIGLPVHGPEIRDRLRELRRREYRLQGRSECSELNVRRVQVQETTAVAVGDIERVVPIRARQRGCHDGYSEGFKRLDDDAVAPRAETGWRRQRREQIERQEKLSTKKEPKRVQENRKRGRCGRRGSEEGAGGGYSLEEAS